MVRFFFSVLALAPTVLADVVLSRTVDVLPGTATIVVEGSACTGSDAYGSNNCDLHWGQNYTIEAKLALTQDIVAGSTITIAAKLDNLIPFNAECPACGGKCTLTVPIVKKTFVYQMPDCPISATSLTKSLSLELPAKSPVPLKIGFKGTVTVKAPSGSTVAQLDLNGAVSAAAAAKARAEELRKQARETLGLELGDPCSSGQCSGVDCGIAIGSCVAACAISFPEGCVACIGAYPECCRCASEHFGFDCSYC